MKHSVETAEKPSHRKDEEFLRPTGNEDALIEKDSAYLQAFFAPNGAKRHLAWDAVFCIVKMSDTHERVAETVYHQGETVHIIST